MNALKIAASSLVLALIATSAQAVTITNRDARTYQLKVLEGDRSESFSLQPNSELRDVCSSRCQVTLEGDPEPYELEVADKVEIEEGQMYFADEAAPEPNTNNR